MGDGPLSGRRGVGAQVPGARYVGLPAVEVTEELLDRRAAVAELGAELRALADLVTRTRPAPTCSATVRGGCAKWLPPCASASGALPSRLRWTT